MLKKILSTLALLLVIGYLLAAVTAFNYRPATTCTGIGLTFTDTAGAGFITPAELTALLARKGLDPTGRPLDQVSTARLEEALLTHPLISRAECYKAPSGKVCFEVSRRIPILYVMGNRGDSYYLDDRGAVMPPSARSTAPVPVATGSISRAFAVRALYPLACHIRHDPFWQAQTQQIHVLPDSTLELVPRVGDHILYLGTPDGFGRKLHRVKTFYRKALNKVGWNRYRRISVEFDNQIICTKTGE